MLSPLRGWTAEAAVPTFVLFLALFAGGGAACDVEIAGEGWQPSRQPAGRRRYNCLRAAGRARFARGTDECVRPHVKLLPLHVKPLSSLSLSLHGRLDAESPGYAFCFLPLTFVPMRSNFRTVPVGRRFIWS